ncbi:MAG: peptidoglycan-binding protein [Minisyncoccales bacterium]
MKKIITLTLLIALGLGMFEVSKAQLTIGQTGEDVSNLQEVLKEDPEIYPEGYVTGYFGKLTEKAVKKLQKKCGLPETGIADEKTLKCIFPEVKITVISPNGGENWDRNEIQTIKWKVEVAPGEEFLPEKYIWRKASIDLFKRVNSESVFVKHIATVDLFATAYSWRITPDIKNGSDYVIRISAGERIVPMIRAERMKKEVVQPPEPVPPVPPWKLAFDESDGTFTISGEIQPRPDLSEVIKILEEINRDLERITANLKRALDLLKGITITY